MYKKALNIGTLAGLCAFGLFLSLYYLGVSPFGLGRVLGVPIAVTAIIWTQIATRNKVLGGNITFLQAFMVGSITTLIWCTCKGFCMYIFMTVFEQQVIEQYLTFLTEYIELAKSMNQEDAVSMIDMEEIRNQTSPSSLMIADISNNIMFGSLVSFISALIIKRTPKAG